MLLDEINLYIALRPKNIHQVSINLKDSLSVVSRAGIKISNTKMMEEMDDENRDVAIGISLDLFLMIRKNEFLVF